MPRNQFNGKFERNVASTSSEQNEKKDRTKFLREFYLEKNSEQRKDDLASQMVSYLKDSKTPKDHEAKITSSHPEVLGKIKEVARKFAEIQVKDGYYDRNIKESLKAVGLAEKLLGQNSQGAQLDSEIRNRLLSWTVGFETATGKPITLRQELIEKRADNLVQNVDINKYHLVDGQLQHKPETPSKFTAADSYGQYGAGANQFENG